MAAKIIAKLYIISMVYSIVKQSMLIHGQPQVPCLFFLGDSILDNGNNNNLSTYAKANYFPYGIDYPGGVATGRFSNGKNMADFLAEFLGFEESIPPFATVDGSEIRRGVNYASGGSGILNETGKKQGDRICMNQQVENHGSVVSNITISFGNKSLAQEYLNQCLYVSFIGSNDYLNNYFLPQDYPTSKLFTPQQFAAFLIKQYSQQLMTLYKYGARKIAVFGQGLVGCEPMVTTQYSPNGSCLESYNTAAQEFNTLLKPLVQNLNKHLPNAQFIFINMSSIAARIPFRGTKIEENTCCKVSSNLTGLCEAGIQPCVVRNVYSFWDKFHPNEDLGRIMILNAYNVLSPTDAYPYDIHHLVQQN